jgi:ribonuclease HI
MPWEARPSWRNGAADPCRWRVFFGRAPRGLRRSPGSGALPVRGRFVQAARQDPGARSRTAAPHRTERGRSDRGGASVPAGQLAAWAAACDLGRMESTVPKAAAPWLLFADGAARGNPGPAAGGYVLDDGEGRQRAQGAVVLGAATNNVAEYKALLAGLARALELGVTALEVRMDSELVVRQMCGVYRVRNEGLKPLFAEAQELSRRFASFRIQHVPREQNARADAEANKALDAARS